MAETSVQTTKYKIEFGLGGAPIVAANRGGLIEELKREKSTWDDLGKSSSNSGINAIQPLNTVKKKVSDILELFEGDTSDSAALKRANDLSAHLCRADSQLALVIAECVKKGLYDGTSTSILFERVNAQQITTTGQNQFGIATGVLLKILTHPSMGKVDAWGTTSEWVAEQRKNLVELSEMALKSKEELEASEDLYKTQIKMRASQSYWSGRARSNKIYGYIWLAATIAAAGASVLLVISLAFISIASSFYFQDLYSSITKSVAFATVAGIAIWSIKFCSNTYSMHKHMENDASERVTLVASYLALVDQSESVDSAQLDIVLRALFRPGTDGLINQDGNSPMSAIELVQKIQKNPQDS